MIIEIMWIIVEFEILEWFTDITLWMVNDDTQR